MKDAGDDQDASKQVEVVSFRPDEEIRRFLKRKFKAKWILKNKSSFHQSVYRAGMKTMGTA